MADDESLDETERLIARLKLAEIPVAGIAALGFMLHSVPLLFVALGAFGTIGALFGPIKYGILPVHLETRELPAGNALVETWANLDTGSWTITVTQPGGPTCLVASGQAFERLAEALPDNDQGA